MSDTPTQASRRIKYGLNVAVAALVAVALVGVLNLLAYKFAPVADMTALGRYSLSPQTRAVLANLQEDYTLATLLTADTAAGTADHAAALRQTRDLADVYARAAGRITARHFTLDRDVAGIESFLRGIESRYDEQLTPVKRAVERGRAALGNLAGEIPAQIEVLRQILDDESFGPGELREFVTLVAQALGRFAQRYAEIDQPIAEMLAQPMADYGVALQSVKSSLGEMKEKVFERAAAQFERGAKDEAVPAAVRDKLLAARELFGRSIEALRDAEEAVNEAPEPTAYNELRGQVGGATDVVVIVGPRAVQVVSLTDIAPDLAQAPTEQRPELRFLGEERITGALISMSMKQPPLVVFVSTGQRPAVGPRGEYEHVARRLRNVSFEVQQWNPAGQMMQTGFMAPAGEPPLPKQGQQAVWVVLPMVDQNPMNPVAGQAAPQVVQLLESRAAAGDGVFIITSVNPASRFGGPDPVGQWLAPWGITPQVDRIILRERTLPDGRKLPTTQFAIEQWPTELPVTAALSGMQGIIMQGCPLLVGAARSETPTGTEGEGEARPAERAGVTRYPLITVRGERMWAEDDLMLQQPPTFKEANARDSFVVGAAASDDKSRVVVVADPIFASDQITTYSRVGVPGEDAVSLFGAQYPANAELFINGVYWLAGLDELIAASARSQDIRRIAAMEPGTRQAWQWSLMTILPLAALAAGVAVWAVRRRA